MNLIFSRWTRSLLIGCMIIHGGVHAMAGNDVITIKERKDRILPGIAALSAGFSTLFFGVLTREAIKAMSEHPNLSGDGYFRALTGLVGGISLGSVHQII